MGLPSGLFIFLLCILKNSSSERVSDNYMYNTEGHNQVVVCYWGTWANYRASDGKFTPENVDGSLCTHLVYSFAGLDTDTWSIKSLDPWMDLEDDHGLAGFKKATDLKHYHPELKVSIAIGGWNEGSKKYSAMARDSGKRAAFVSSVILFLKKYKFDGLDLDWEYPGKRGGIPEDKANFVKLCQELRAAFDKHGFLLTAAIGAAQDTIDKAYDIPVLYKYLDYVHVMCYDYHGKWDRETGHNAPLHSRPDEPKPSSFLNVEYTVKYLLKKGASKKKTVLGVPFYGRAFSLMNPHDNGLGAKSKATSFQGPFTREDGFLGYNEICIEQETSVSDSWTTVWEKYLKAPYMFKGTKWISYDNEESLKLKAKFAYEEGLAGVMVWSIDTDDFRGDCTTNGVKFPLLRTLNNALYKEQNGIDSSANTAIAYCGVVFALLQLVIQALR